MRLYQQEPSGNVIECTGTDCLPYDPALQMIGHSLDVMLIAYAIGLAVGLAALFIWSILEAIKEK